jgi:hypothetical protein
MATRNSSRVERRCVLQDTNRPCTRPKHSGRKATKVRPPSAEPDECPKDSDACDSDVLRRLPVALAGWLTTDARVDRQETRIGG